MATDPRELMQQQLIAQRAAAPAINPAGLVPAQRPRAPVMAKPAAAMPPDLNKASIVPVARDDIGQRYAGVQAALGGPDPLAAREAQLAAMRQAAPQEQALQQAQQAIVQATPEQRQQMAAVGGATMGRMAAARNPGLARAAATYGKQQMLNEVVSDKALPFLNQRRPGLLGY